MALVCGPESPSVPLYCGDEVGVGEAHVFVVAALASSDLSDEPTSLNSRKHVLTSEAREPIRAQVIICDVVAGRGYVRMKRPLIPSPSPDLSAVSETRFAEQCGDADRSTNLGEVPVPRHFLEQRRHPRRNRPSTPVHSRTARRRPHKPHQPRPGVRLRDRPRGGRRGLHGDGRATRNQVSPPRQ